MSTRRELFLRVLVLFFSLGLFHTATRVSAAEVAPLQQFSWRQWQTDDGLPNNSVQCIFQADDGYLWVGTQDGLARFDGMVFTPFSPSSAPALKGRWCSTILQTRDGCLWIGTDGKGLVRVMKDGSASILTRKEGLVSDAVRTLFEDRDGVLWIGTAGGLSRFADGKMTGFPMRVGGSQDVIRSICQDRAGTIWMATGAGLKCVRDGMVAEPVEENLQGDLVARTTLRTVHVDDEGSLWIGGNSGLIRWKDGQITTFGSAEGMIDTSVTVIYQDRQRHLWVGTFGGLHRFADGRLIAEVQDEDIFSDVVYAMHQDAEDNLWVGTRGGLHRLNARRFTSLTKQQGLSHNVVVSVLAEKSGKVWVGTWGGGVNGFQEGKVQQYQPNPSVPFYLVLGMHQARDGSLWLGTDYDNGLYRFHLDGGVERWGTEQGMTEAALSVLLEDRTGNLWIGARTGLLRFRDGQFTRFTTNEGLPSSAIKVLIETHDGALGIGTADGLSFLREGKFINFGVSDGLSAGTILALLEDGERNLWIGTKGGGLNCFRAGKFTAYTTREGLSFDDVYEIIEHDGFFWMSCSKGIFRIRKSDFDEFDRGTVNRLTSIAYNKADGLLSSDCKGVAKPAACKTPDGRLWFPSGAGVVIADPNVKLNSRPPPVFVEKIVADKESFSGGDGLRLRPGRGELEFHFTALSFQAPEKNRFKYRLDGVDPDWVDADGRRVAYYNNIPPGEYRFQVIAANNDGVWNQSGAKVNFTLLPHYWQTWWFKVFSVLAVTGVLTFGYRVRVAQLREIERLRVRIAADLHDEVGSSLWSISLLSGILKKNDELNEHERRDLGEINRIALSAAGAIRDIVWFIKPEYDTMNDLVLRMRDATNVLLTGIEHRFTNSPGNMTRKLPIDLRQNAFLMFKEALTNIARHSEATFVEVDISESAGRWQMRIRDNGVGFDSAVQPAGNGLKNLHNRAQKLKGILEIKSQRGCGTTVTFSVEL